MITLITGVPGSGKTCALVDLLCELAVGRALFVDGIPDLKIPHVPMGDVHRWHEEVPDGAAIVIDEVQRVWRPSRQKVPDDIAQLETHRHRGLDFFIVTQNPSLVHANVRALVGRHVHLRDNGVLGRWWYEWPECCPTPSSSYKAAPVKKQYRLSKKAQALYTSASMHIKPIRSIPRALVVFALSLPVVGLLGWKVYERVTGVMHPVPVAAKGEHRSASADLSRELASGTTSAAGAQVEPVVYRAGHAVPEPVEPASDAASAAAEAAPGPAQPKGCIASADRCRCFDGGGMLIVMPPEQCREAIGVAGKVLPLDVPLVRNAPEVGRAARDVPPIPMHETRRTGRDLVDVGARSATGSWQAKALQDIERM
jgi:zona occludens toxin